MSPSPAGSLRSRRVEPEILDALSPDDSLAQGSRRDLALVNRLMFHPALLATLLRRHMASPPRRILEIGAGDGAFSLALARRLAPDWLNVEITLLDRAACVPPERVVAFETIGWRVNLLVGDVFEALPQTGEAPFDLAVANLFLHHFEAPALAKLFALLTARARIVAAAEPHRDRFSLAASHLLWAVGANAVTRHDAPASVRAGFRAGELGPIWLSAGGGPVLTERRAGPFSLLFAAEGKVP